MTNTNPEARDVIADWLADHDVNPPRGKSINDLASAIIAALAAEGMVIVPREPTKAMLEASDTDNEWLEDDWRKMIAAALTTPTLPPAGDER